MAPSSDKNKCNTPFVILEIRRSLAFKNNCTDSFNQRPLLNNKYSFVNLD